MHDWPESCQRQRVKMWLDWCNRKRSPLLHGNGKIVAPISKENQTDLNSMDGTPCALASSGACFH
jgi:hypothetical protein